MEASERYQTILNLIPQVVSDAGGWRASSERGIHLFRCFSQLNERVLIGGEEVRDGKAAGQTIQEQINRCLFDRSAERQYAWGGCLFHGCVFFLFAL